MRLSVLLKFTWLNRFSNDSFFDEKTSVIQFHIIQKLLENFDEKSNLKCNPQINKNARIKAKP